MRKGKLNAPTPYPAQGGAISRLATLDITGALFLLLHVKAPKAHGKARLPFLGKFPLDEGLKLVREY